MFRLDNRSDFIDCVRFFAASTVALAHLRAALLPDYKAVAEHPLWFGIVAFFSGYAGDAVMIFFVISGWLVGGSLLNTRHKPRVYSEYAIARTCRIGTVLLPLFVLQLTIHVTSGGDVIAPFNLQTLAGNLVGLQTIYVPFYGNNFPLWSLANETAYYVAFAIIVALSDSRFSSAAKGALLTVLIGYTYILTAEIRLYFLIWLIGVAASQITVKPNLTTVVACLAIFSMIVLIKRLANIVTDLPYDILSSLPFAACLIFLKSERQHSSRAWAHLSGFSFSLYVTHVPVISALGVKQDLANVSSNGLLLYTSDSIIVLGCALLFSLLFEQRYPKVRRIFTDLLNRTRNA